MKILRSLWYALRVADRRWVLGEIHPLHPDVPQLVVEKAELEDKLRHVLQ